MKTPQIVQALSKECNVAPAVAKHFLDELSDTAIREVRKNGVFVLPGIGRLVRIDKNSRPRRTFERNPPPAPKSPGRFRNEFDGTRKKPPRGVPIQADCRHGRVVNQLARALKRRALTVGRDKSRDLYCWNQERHRIATLFEVKSESAMQDVYTAVGQLLLNSNSMSPRPRLVLVAPDDIGQQTCSALAALNIDVLKYKLRGDEVSFGELAGLLTTT